MYHAFVYTQAAILLIQEIWLVGRLDSKWEDIFSAVKYDLHVFCKFGITSLITKDTNLYIFTLSVDFGGL